ncbi:GNAT family N-acetyltransferase [Microlunatus panaciterrae]|uniref:GNAT superfamily N-acetyltransferase n=1 Tax=Microlunatus panaciterrae TaxID=400768 RepID=A0ABS2RKT9_9ACTN|nr:GNAT family N-acetyltransferase [Microlunatus panaciterrae]MBM7799102.1 GNAT superfamily N-acetyltransferase [Microlunatus panaciterrae]
MELTFFDQPGSFLERAGDYLAADPLINTVVASVTSRLRTDWAEGVPRDPHVPYWWLVVTDDSGQIVGAGMRSAPAPPYPMYLLPMPDEAAVQVARQLHATGEWSPAANGALPAVRLCMDELGRLAGGTPRTSEHTRLFELGELIMPDPVPGRLRLVSVGEADLAVRWVNAFRAAADEQSGRQPRSGDLGTEDLESMLRRIEQRRIWFWEDGEGRPVHLTGANAPAFGVARIGPVFTPKAHRGHGYASAAVAAVSRHLLGQGARVCLFTDQANPVSNRIYQALGFRPVADMANLVIG